MQKAIQLIDAINEKIGGFIAWCAVLMVLVQFFVVIARYVFFISHPAVQESIWYFHGIFFMIGAGYTLLYNGHVRVDVFYREGSDRFKAMVDLAGSLFLLLPVAFLTFWLSRNYILDSWFNFNTGEWVLEGSTEVAGLPLIFLLRTVIWFFALLIALQGISLALKAMCYLTGVTESYQIEPEDGMDVHVE